MRFGQTNPNDDRMHLKEWIMLTIMLRVQSKNIGNKTIMNMQLGTINMYNYRSMYNMYILCI